jgi:hypothetical protein
MITFFNSRGINFDYVQAKRSGRLVIVALHFAESLLVSKYISQHCRTICLTAFARRRIVSAS